MVQKTLINNTDQKDFSIFSSQYCVLSQGLYHAESRICLERRQYLIPGVLNWYRMDFTICSEKCEKYWLGVIKTITWDKWVLEDNNVFIQFQSIWTYLRIVFVNDIFCQKQYSHVCRIIFFINNDFNLLDRFWRELKSKWFSDGYVFVILYETNLSQWNLVSQPVSIWWVVSHMIQSA